VEGGFFSLRLHLSIQPLPLAASTPVSHEFPHIVVRLNRLSGLVAHAGSLMGIEFAHSLADVAADLIHQFAVAPLFEHGRDRQMAKIVRTQLIKTGDIAQMVP
jgi:uncharacterized protein with ACT and thioredoxin-like domain